MTEKPLTHDAYALRRENRHRSRYIEIGNARIKAHCPHCQQEVDAAGVQHVYLDRSPIGGFTGHVYLSPKGVRPPDPKPEPERPGDDAI